jgi:small subunit ribosomal protein S19e
MPSIHDIHPSKAITKAAEQLKKDIQVPKWTNFVKTSVGKANPPENNDWYHQRAASILRRVYLFGPIGTNKLKVKYSTKKNRGHKRERFRKGSGKIIRSILQDLEKTGYIKKDKKGNHSGRIITPKGKSFMDRLANGPNQQRRAPETPAKPAGKTEPAPQAN